LIVVRVDRVPEQPSFELGRRAKSILTPDGTSARLPNRADDDEA
jgi:hypothetical protein